jgi:hypothetical protein
MLQGFMTRLRRSLGAGEDWEKGAFLKGILLTLQIK